MRRMLVWCAVGTAIGFSFFGCFFWMVIPFRGGPEDVRVVLAFTIVPAVMIGFLAAVFGAVSVLVEEIGRFRDDVTKLLTIDPTPVDPPPQKERPTESIRSIP